MKKKSSSIFGPSHFWLRIAGMPRSWTRTTTLVLLPSLVLAALVEGAVIFLGKPIGNFSQMQTLRIALIADAAVFCTLLVLAFSLKLVSTWFGGRRDFVSSYNVIVFAWVPTILGSLLSMPLVFLGSWTLALQIVFWIYSLLIFYNGARRYLEIPKSPVAVGFLCVLAIALPLALGGLVVLILNGVLFFLVDTFY